MISPRARSLRARSRVIRASQQAKVFGAGVLNAVVRYGRIYRETLALAEQVDSYSDDRAIALQRELLSELLLDIKDGSPWYSERLSEFSRADLRRIAAEGKLDLLPTLDKSDLRHYRPMIENRHHRTIARSRTSGSTGSPLMVGHDRRSVQTAMALVHHQRRQLVGDIRHRHVRATGRILMPTHLPTDRPWMRNPAEGQLLVSTYHLHGTGIQAIRQEIERFNPVLFEGYPSALALIASGGGRYPSLRGAITTAETLSPEMRALLRDSLGIPVRDYYSASEGAPILYECEQGSYHLRPESGVVEVLDDDGRPSKPGEVGALVVTSFRQLRTPLLRYQIGDRGAVATGPCSCGRPLNTVSYIEGREDDLIVTPDGRRIGMFNYRTMKFVKGIEESQIIQLSPTDFVVKVVAQASDLTQLENEVCARFAEALGYEPSVTLELVDSVPRSGSGKVRATIRAF